MACSFAQRADYLTVICLMPSETLDYQSPSNPRSRPPLYDVWSAVCGFVAVGLPAFIYFVVYGGHPHLAFDLAGAVVCVSLPLLFVSVGLAIAAQRRAEKRVPVLLIAWSLVLAQAVMWILVAYDATYPSGHSAPGGF